MRSQCCGSIDREVDEPASLVNAKAAGALVRGAGYGCQPTVLRRGDQPERSARRTRKNREEDGFDGASQRFCLPQKNEIAGRHRSQRLFLDMAERGGRRWKLWMRRPQRPLLPPACPHPPLSFTVSTFVGHSRNPSPIPRHRADGFVLAKLVTSSHASSVASLEWTRLDRLVLPFYRENREDFAPD